MAPPSDHLRCVHPMLPFLRSVLVLALVLLNNVFGLPAYLMTVLLFRPLLWIHPILYWRLEGIFVRYLSYCITLWVKLAAFDIYLFGDDLFKYQNERCLVIVNHQSSSDVPLLVTLFSGARPGVASTLWILDGMFKWTNFGLISQIHGDFFIRESTVGGKYSTDQLRAHLQNTYWSRDRRWIILFPEGGFLYKRRTRSQLFALKNNYPVLQNVTLPRIGAAKAILDVVVAKQPSKGNTVMHKDDHIFVSKSCDDAEPPLTYLIDLTMAYSGGVPLSLFNIVSCSQRHSRIELHCRVYPIDDVPVNEDAESDELLRYMYDRWVEKEDLLTHFYEKGSFAAVSQAGAGVPMKVSMFDIVLSQLIVFCLPVLYFLLFRRLSLLVANVFL